jgi:hypothetical protein
MRTTALLMLLIASTVTLAVGSGGSPSTGPSPGGQESEPPVVCGFKNASYAGLCEERTPYVKDKKLEAICKPILDCLNDTRCIKTYCGATTIRQGWVLESATRAK